MRRRNARIREFTTTDSTRFLCAKFGPKTSLIASGDDKSLVSLWQQDKEYPVTTFSSQGSNQNILNEVSAVCFDISEKQVFSGTNRGSVFVWDIESQKLARTLKGHSSAVNCISSFPLPTNEHLVLTGSSDSLVKLWDLRHKHPVANFKGHDLQVNCIEPSPDGKWFASGSNDSFVKLWDIGSEKSFQTFDLHEGPITCLKFNPYDLTLVTGSADKTVKYWDLEDYRLICTTKPESTAIQSLIFDIDGKYLFTAAQDILRVWNVDIEELQLLDNVESNWKGVQDLVVQPGVRTEEDKLHGVAITSTSFGLWSCQLKTVNRDPNLTPEKYYQLRKQLESKTKPVVQSQEINQSPMEFEKPKPSKPKLEAKNRNSQEYMQMASVEGNNLEQLGKIQGTRMEEERQPFHEQNPNAMELSASIIQVNKMDPRQLNMDSFLEDKENKDKSAQFDAISDIAKDHSKFNVYMSQRLNHLELVLHYWNSGNVRSALNTINKLNLNDSTLIMDLLNMSSTVLNKTGQLNPEAACIFLQKAVMLIESKFDHHIKMGLQFILKVFRQFHDEIIKIKMVHLINMVDLAREERLKKYDKLIDEFETIARIDRVKKIASKNKGEVSELANQLLTSIESFLNKIKSKSSQRR